jgi:transposase
MQTTIKSLHKKGFSNTYIARTLGVSRNTVSKVIRSEERGEEQLVKKPHPSMLDEYREFIEIQLNKGLRHNTAMNPLRYLPMWVMASWKRPIS